MRRGLQTAAVIAAAAILVAPAGASAKKKKKRKPVPVQVHVSSATTAAATPSFIEATATCPAGTTAIGGGVNVPVPTDMSTAFITDAQRVGETQWKARALANVAPGGSLSVTAEVYCAKLRGLVSTIPATATIGGTTTSFPQEAHPVAGCPAGTQLLSGGFTTSFTSGTGVPYRNAPAANGWAGDFNFSGPSSGSGTVTVEAYCFTPAKVPKKKKGKKASVAKKKRKKARFQNPRPLKVLTADAAFTTTVYTSSSVSTPVCPAPLRAISGGFSAAKPSTPSFAAFNGTHLVGGGWTATAQQFADPASPSTLTAYVGCA